MNCPNCKKEMVDESYSKLEKFYHWEDEDYYYKENYYSKFICDDCQISFEHNKWYVPDSLKPTEKQKRTISFINNRLRIDLDAITRHQCWLDINKYFDKAKNTPKYSYEDWLKIQEYFGMCEGDFC